MAKQPEKPTNPGNDTGTPKAGPNPNPKTPGDKADKSASAPFDTNAGQPEPGGASGPRQTAPAGSMGGGTVPGASAPAVPSPESADPGRTAAGTTGAPPSAATGKPQNAYGDLPERDPGAVGGTGPDGRGGLKGGAADDTSVRQFLQEAEATVEAAIAGQWGAAIAGAGQMLNVFADVFSSGFTNGRIFGASDQLQATQEHADVRKRCDEIQAKCQKARERVMEVQARTRRVRWGGEHDASTGAPPGMAADPQTIDPSAILLVIEMVMKLIQEFRNRSTT